MIGVRRVHLFKENRATIAYIVCNVRTPMSRSFGIHKAGKASPPLSLGLCHQGRLKERGDGPPEQEFSKYDLHPYLLKAASEQPPAEREQEVEIHESRLLIGPSNGKDYANCAHANLDTKPTKRSLQLRFRLLLSVCLPLL